MVGNHMKLEQVLLHLELDIDLRKLFELNILKVEKHFRYPITTTPEGVVAGLEELSTLMKPYGRAFSRWRSKYFQMLERQRELWSKEYNLEVLTDSCAQKRIKRLDKKITSKRLNYILNSESV